MQRTSDVEVEPDQKDKAGRFRERFIEFFHLILQSAHRVSDFLLLDESRSTLDERIPLKNQWLAGVLALFVPGLGHLYQGRVFKAAIYFFCILGLFMTGMAMADWQAVQPPYSAKHHPMSVVSVMKFGVQMSAGLPAMPGLLQIQRYQSSRNTLVTELQAPVTVDFVGVVDYRDATGLREDPAIGTLLLEPVDLQFGGKSIAGKFQGEVNGQATTLELGNHLDLGKPVDANKRQSVAGRIVEVRDGQEQTVGHIKGGIPRRFWNWYAVPMSEENEEELHAELGKTHELAVLCTLVAGLLNLLAIWDAVQGPAHGYFGFEETVAVASPSSAPPPPPPVTPE